MAKTSTAMAQASTTTEVLKALLTPADAPSGDANSRYHEPCQCQKLGAGGRALGRQCAQRVIPVERSPKTFNGKSQRVHLHDCCDQSAGPLDGKHRPGKNPGGDQDHTHRRMVPGG